MIKLEKIFDILFDDVKITDSRILPFFGSNIIAIQLHNQGHVFDQILADSQAKKTALENKIGSKSETLTDQFSSTITVVEYESQFVDLVHTAQATVLTKCTKKSDIYKEFFPLKWDNYIQPHRDEIGNYIDHFKARFTAHTSDYGTAMITAFTNLQNSFVPARSTQVQNKQEVKTLIEETSVERENVNLQLYINLHTLALAYPGKPEMVKVFFDVSQLFPHPYGGESPIGVVHKIKVKPGKTINTHLRGIEDKSVKIINLKKSKLAVFTVSSLKKPVVPPEAMIVAEGETKTANIDTLSSNPKHKYLLICNLDTEIGETDVELQGKIK